MAREISSLFWIVTLIAFIVGIFVEALLVYTILKYRASPPGEGAAEEPPATSEEEATKVHPAHHGNPRVEGAIAGVTAIAFALLVVFSWGTLFAIETPPEGDSMTVEVIGHQWSWEFHYPEEGVTELAPVSEMHVPLNKIVRLNVTSSDVAHAAWIPDLGVKIDAYPGRWNHFWFQAEREGRFLLQCAEFCGGAHSNMHAVVVVESQAAYADWVRMKVAQANPPPPPLTEGAQVTVNLSDYRIELSYPLEVEQGANITLHISNTGTAAHAFALDAPYAWSSPLLNASGSLTATVRFDALARDAHYYCPVAGHRALGMEGTFNVTPVPEGRIIDVELLDSGIPGKSFRIEPARIELQPGEKVRFRVFNNGTMLHNLKLDAPYPIDTPWLDAGESTLTPTITASESVKYWCDVPGHRQSGMEGSLVVGGEGVGPSGGPAVPGFDALSLLPAVSLAATWALWSRSRRRTA